MRRNEIVIACLLALLAFSIAGTVALLASKSSDRVIDEAAVTDMSTDLLVLAEGQEKYRAEHGRYGSLDFTPYTYKVKVVVDVRYPNEDGWRALATHAFSKKVCGISVNMGRPYGTKVDGIPACR